jgi:hypothetical protein
MRFSMSKVHSLVTLSFIALGAAACAATEAPTESVASEEADLGTQQSAATTACGKNTRAASVRASKLFYYLAGVPNSSLPSAMAKGVGGDCGSARDLINSLVDRVRSGNGAKATTSKTSICGLSVSTAKLNVDGAGMGALYPALDKCLGDGTTSFFMPAYAAGASGYVIIDPEVVMSGGWSKTGAGATANATWSDGSGAAPSGVYWPGTTLTNCSTGKTTIPAAQRVTGTPCSVTAITSGTQFTKTLSVTKSGTCICN